MKVYKVEVIAKFPAWGEQPGVIEVFAKDSKAAITKARHEMANNGHTRQDGPLKYKVLYEIVTNTERG